MKNVTLSGTKNGSNTSFTLAQAPVSGGWVWIVHTNYLLKTVGASPAVGQCTISGTAVVVGLAPESNDPLFAVIQTAADKGLTRVILSGVKNGETGNKSFTLPISVPANSNAVLLLNGMVLEEVSSSPAIEQFTIAGQTVTLAIGLDPQDELAALIETAVTIT
ncbi:MAG: hypothetical protein ACRDRT_03285, partial [Pseudonocardiaceae bacterium]